MKYIKIIAFILLSNVAFSQMPDLKLPEFLPPSPDVSALMKGAELSASMYSGAANASIPIYEIKVRDYSLPVSINYSANGYKPEEICSRTGIGWTLNAGGVVSRIQRGKPDDFCTTPTPYTVSEIQAYNSATVLGYLDDLEDQGSYHDSQPDEYRYTVNGLTGKFFIARDNSIIQLPYNNVVITVTKTMGEVTEITIKDADGVRYTFGGSIIEETIEHNLIRNFLQKQHIKTAWMLTEIDFPNGDWIDFGYSSIAHWANTGTTTAATKGIIGNVCEALGDTYTCQPTLYTSSKTGSVRYTSYYLTSITTSTGPSVSFTYQDRPDNGGNNRLATISVSNGTSIVKSVELEYVNPAGSTPSGFTNYNYFLKKVIVKDPTGGSAPSQEFELKYVYKDNEYEIKTGEDHLGYATNGISSTPMPPLTETEQIFSSYYTSKYPNGEYSKIGMLQKIIYPTGGHDEFFYEPNMKSWWDSVEVQNIVTARAMGIGSDFSPFPVYTTTFTPSRSQTAEFHLNTSWLGSPPIPDGDPAPITAIATLYIHATNVVVDQRIARGYPGGAHYEVSGDLTAQLSAGVQYRLEVEVRYADEGSARADIVYDAGNTKIWKQLHEELCGVRVRKIQFHDPVSNKTSSRFYKYRSLTDTLTPSAIKQYFPSYLSYIQESRECGSGQLLCPANVYSSNTVSSLYINDAAGVAYKWIVESDDSTYANGCIQHEFDTWGDFLGAIVIGGDIPDRPAEPFSYRSGVDTTQLYFNKDLQLVKKIKHHYSFDDRITTMQLHNYIVRKRYNSFIIGSPYNETDFEHFDVIQHSTYTFWYHLDSTVTWDYDLTTSTALKNKVTYTYNSTTNIQPSVVTTWGSDGIELKTEKKYPDDFTENPANVYNTMVNSNILEPVVQEESYKDTKLLFKTKTDYKDWFNDGKVLAPEIIKKQKNTASEESRIRFYQYDTKGNPLELSKENDMRLTYIWDYNNTLPIAEITNATYGSGVAYTSFESDGKGGWTFSGPASTQGTEPAGSKSYALGGGDITYAGTLVTGKKYIITYWATSTVNVNGTAGTSMLAKASWTLFRKVITYSGSGGITVSGSGIIDELRLYPEGSFMKSFTYTPEIGTTTSADNNSLYQKYEYDVFNRLLRIRDMDNNILKQMEYKYGETITACPNTTANWQFTGTYRCVKNNPTNNNNTGVQEKEERDLNNCSITYGQTRWVTHCSSSCGCTVVSNCTGDDKRVINGVCVTGCKVLISSVYNGNLNWTCTFRYYWEDDDYWGPEITEGGTFHCITTVCGD